MLTLQHPDARPGPNLPSPSQQLAPPPGSLPPGSSFLLTRVTQLFNLTGFALILSGDPLPSPVTTDSFTCMKSQLRWIDCHAEGSKVANPCASRKGHSLISAAPPGPPVPWQPCTPAHLPNLEPNEAVGTSQAVRPVKPRAGSHKALPWPGGPGQAWLPPPPRLPSVKAPCLGPSCVSTPFYSDLISMRFF